MVVGVHVLAGCLLFMVRAPRMSQRAIGSPPLVVVNLNYQPTRLVESTRTRATMKERSAITLSRSEEAEPVRADAVMAVTIADNQLAPSETLPAIIPRLSAANQERVQQSCNLIISSDAVASGLSGTVTFLIELGEDGQVLNTRTEISSGAELLDQVVTHCAREAAPYEPVVIDGQTIRAWQRLVWSWPPPE